MKSTHSEPSSTLWHEVFDRRFFDGIRPLAALWAEERVRNRPPGSVTVAIPS